MVADPIQLLPASIEAKRVEVYSRNFELKEQERRQYLAFIADQDNDPLRSVSFDHSESSSDNSCLQEYDRRKSRCRAARKEADKTRARGDAKANKNKYREKPQSFGGV